MQPGELLFPALADPPDRVAISLPRLTLSYEQLAGATGAVAASLAGARRVVVVADSTPETCVAVVGALRAGVPVVPLNPRSGSAELAHILADAAPDALLVGRECRSARGAGSARAGGG